MDILAHIKLYENGKGTLEKDRKTEDKPLAPLGFD